MHINLDLAHTDAFNTSKWISGQLASLSVHRTSGPNEVRTGLPIRNISYYNKETLLLLYAHVLVPSLNFLNSNPERLAFM